MANKVTIFQTSYGYGLTTLENKQAYAMDENQIVRFNKGEGFDTFEDVASYAMNYLGIARENICFTF
jgi:hypothetical protein